MKTDSRLLILYWLGFIGKRTYYHRYQILIGEGWFYKYRKMGENG